MRMLQPALVTLVSFLKRLFPNKLMVESLFLTVLTKLNFADWNLMMII
jgi:hypothetical protein